MQQELGAILQIYLQEPVWDCHNYGSLIGAKNLLM